MDDIVEPPFVAVKKTNNKVSVFEIERFVKIPTEKLRLF